MLNNVPELIPWHPGSPYKNNSYDWFSSDDEENWLCNCSRSPSDSIELEQFHNSGWADSKNSFTYKINQHGFRGTFNPNPDILTVGCSLTFGVGIPEDETWPTLVAKHFNCSLNNFGMSAISIDTCYRIIDHYVPLLKPKLVLLLSPFEARLEFFDEGARCKSKDDENQFQSWNLLAAVGVRYPKKIKDLYNLWLRHPLNSYYHKKRAYDAIKGVCYDNNVTLVSIDSEKYVDLNSDVFDILDLSQEDYNNLHNECARDISHPGKLRNYYLSKVFINLISDINIL